MSPRVTKRASFADGFSDIERSYACAIRDEYNGRVRLSYRI